MLVMEKLKLNNKINIGMSLKTQIYGLIFVLVSISFFARLIIDINTTKAYFTEQMSVHANDAAINLGLSISPYTDDTNLVIAETMVSAIFDSGYYHSIKFVDNKGNTLIERVNPLAARDIPPWFISMFELPRVPESSEVNNGWNIAGTLTVESHPGLSYEKLWKHAIDTCVTSLVLLIISLTLGYLILSAIFRPLKKLEKQAQSVTHKKFIINDDVPFSIELRTVTKAMNNMVRNLNSTFQSLSEHSETLSKKVFQDELTKLGNRRAFENQFSAIQTGMNKDDVSCLILISLDSLMSINKNFGFAAGDEYVFEVKSIIQKNFNLSQESEMFRISGGTFILMLSVSIEYRQEMLEHLSRDFSQRNTTEFNTLFARASAIDYHKTCKLSDLLSQLDTSPHEVDIISNSNLSAISFTQWRSVINHVIKNKEISFSVQPIKNSSKTVEYCELFSNVFYNDKPLNNNQLFTMAERLELTVELDKAIITKLLTLDLSDYDKPIAINLAKQSLYSNEFIFWLESVSKIAKEKSLKLIFEIKETVIIDSQQQAAQIIAKLKRLGFRVCIEHFAINLTSIKYLQGLNIDYVKLDGSFISNLKCEENQYFLRTLITLSHGLGIKFIACLIEDNETYDILIENKCEYFQGRYIALPSHIVIDK
ncbi:EAL domain-containing protein [Pseudoalteromonas sp. SG43-4]|uniref:bifunctional diguanylate cyclase/phosphodiesterase n=1 Tax=Pseudoalteromonas sp. SG43-4 TaxID=2760969 RepID=UPI0016015DAF|nr:EAL domain-containing protein [Pseudoalteromonas sp. SG43-4]MBB1432539.1 EAL domain-containing protein [Pseudoalteromonas sp. SG43-4]